MFVSVVPKEYYKKYIKSLNKTLQQSWRTFLSLRNAWLRFKWWQENREACLLSDDGNKELKKLQMMNWIEDSLNQMQNTKNAII